MKHEPRNASRATAPPSGDDYWSDRCQACGTAPVPLDHESHCALCAARREAWEEGQRHAILEQFEDAIHAARRYDLLSPTELRDALEHCLAAHPEDGWYVLTGNAR